MKQVTEQEKLQIESLKERFAELVVRVGSLRLEESLLRKELDGILSSLKEQESKLFLLKDEEKMLFDALEKKYGTSVNFDTGEIA